MNSLFRNEIALNKRQKLEGNISLIQPPLFKILALFILAAVLISVLFLSLSTYKKKETVNGILQPNSGLLKLTATQGGVIFELLVDEGELVKRGQPILRIISERHGVQHGELNQSIINQHKFQKSNLENKLLQEHKTYDLEINGLRSDRASLISRISQLNDQSETFQKRIKLNQEIIERITILANTGNISELDLKRQKDNLLSLNQQSSANVLDRLSLENQLQQVDSQLEQKPIEHSKVIDQIKIQLKEVGVQLATKEQQRLSELRAPANGVVTGLLVKVGKTVSNGQTLASLIPEDSILQAILYVPTSAFGFISDKQKTQIRYDAFPYQRFGLHNGIVSEISLNVILPTETATPGIISQPSYRVIVDLEKDYIKANDNEIPLKAGMMLEADIIIEERSLLTWLLNPILSVAGRL